MTSAGELSEGVVMLGEAAGLASTPEARQLIEHARAELQDPDVPASAKHDVALGEELLAVVLRDEHREGRVRLDAPQTIEADRLRARFGAWYELFPRSWGGLAGVQAQLPGSPSSGSTCSTCRRSTRSASPTARAPTTGSSRGRPIPARRMRSGRLRRP